MFSKSGIWTKAACVGLTALLTLSCAVDRKLNGVRNGTVRADVSIPSDEDYRRAKEEIMREAIVDTATAQASGGPLIMNAIRDEETGEMVATDVIAASTVVARFRNVAERFGKVNIEFDITVPPDMLESSWKLELLPVMRIMGDSTALEPVHVTGRKYRDEQMRGYARYNRFISSIITDSADFVRIGQLEIFIRRYFPEVFAMKSDSSYVSDREAENIFGVTLAQVQEHYTKAWLVSRNDRRIAGKERMFRKYVKDPLVDAGLRLDTVLTSADGSFIYRYVQEVSGRPGLKRIDLSMRGSLYNAGRMVCEVRSPEDLTFYISSLSNLIDPTPRYVMRILERTAYDNTRAFLDFEQGKALIDTSLAGNASELRRIRRAVDNVMALDEFVLDSITVTASCSPEGSYAFNSKLARSRSETVVGLLSEMMDGDNDDRLLPSSIPENWEQLELLARNDSLISEDSKLKVAQAAQMKDRDAAEGVLKTLPEFRHIAEHIYPQLRTVRFGFYLHRRGMLKDTVHTTEIDTVYMAGVEAIRDLDYKRAVELLRPYHDYNTALAYISAGYNHSALKDLEDLRTDSARRDYLLAIVLSRLERKKEAADAFLSSVEKDPSMVFRANLDPELAEFVNGY
ncbi:MAG: hypothetical protein LUC24_00035 [Bacteroidales bacterium]|nr:hypothetical protein [Bacteroidales bacterium]